MTSTAIKSFLAQDDPTGPQASVITHASSRLGGFWHIGCMSDVSKRELEDEFRGESAPATKRICMECGGFIQPRR